jgi:acyl-CoA thioester hydrolase
VRHVYECPLRWADMDAFGHVNNVVFLRYLEEARIDLFFRVAREALTGSSGAFSEGVVVARHEIDYRKPLTYRHEPVVVELWVTRVGGASITVAYEVKDGDDAVYARAASVVVLYDLKRGGPRRITAEERSFIEKYAEEEAGEAA